MSQPEVLTPLTDGNIEAVMNWQSPFENVGPDQKFSSFSALLQVGGFSTLIAQLKRLFPQANLDAVSDAATTLEGRSNMTKLNSTQVFNGAAPVKIPVTAHFRAFRDAHAEVRAPMDQLMQWSLPQKIAETIISAGKLFPSETPQIVGMKYADMLFMPLVIEQISHPLTGPRDAQGRLAHVSLTMQLATLTALDRNDWRATRNLADVI
ncbi:hypothetical protein [Variovorax paradoxus]|uniref:hypothetical protein n=1 Tax=Variovorax paradoxus TaxID=34073 RepID=UPI002781EDB6|nr:hypothetical protein [Variovorax paradoxus]MDQ0591001.1 hypothetical protein [Variovorax paradoxus]